MRGLALLLMAAASFAEPAITTVPEMQRIPALEASAADRSPPKKPPLAFVRAWKPLAPRVAKLLTPALVRSLSRWAKKEMERYARVPPVERPTFTVDRVTPEGTLVLAARLDTLPSHSPIVTRWLELVATFDPSRNVISNVWITIRGQAEE